MPLDQRLVISATYSLGKGNYKEIHSQINQVLENFDEHIDNILERNEKDFLAAYRGHMVKVQKELEYFKAKTR